ncbi:MAG: hypothetical protein EHM30_03215 [Desulfobacteraceae bacterium]|nr:MAG: hypothetical protein EHM30_03215 [Desulfobacteraceae bacterium]
MKKIDTITLLLKLGLVWLAAVPVLFLLLFAPPQETIRQLAKYGADLPALSEPLIHYITLGRVFALGILASLFAIAFHVRKHEAKEQALSQLAMLNVWHILLFIIFFVTILPCIKLMLTL